MQMMTEKEKAARGELYDANNDTCLQREMKETRCKLFEYNRIHPEEEQLRSEKLRLIVNIGAHGVVLSPFHCDYGYNIHIGDYFFANVNLVILDGARVTIGNHVFVGPGVGIHTAGHPLDAGVRRQGLEYARPVTIGDDVWIGAGVQILPGVTIGSRSVIGAGSVVVCDIPSDVVAVGNPCRVVKTIGKEEVGQ